MGCEQLPNKSSLRTANRVREIRFSIVHALRVTFPYQQFGRSTSIARNAYSGGMVFWWDRGGGDVQNGCIYRLAIACGLISLLA
jgi:hypothetical protein